MTAVTVLHVPPGGWTVDDLPDRDAFRYELVDGALLVTPPPTPRHSGAAARLQLRLGAAVGEGWDVLAAAGVYFDRHNYREPDVSVVRSAALAQDRLTPGDVLLVVEVMSPSSVATDRVAKPAQYAAAGIAHYWRLEQEPPRLVRYALVDGVYREAGSAGGVVVVREPLDVEVDVDALFA
jgi:Uma2 family endonuclease